MFGLGLVISSLGSIASTIASALTMGSKILNSVASAFTIFANALGGTQIKDPKDLGDKIIQAEEEDIRPENFDTYEEYMKRIDEFEVDRDKSKEIDDDVKIVRALDAASKVLVEKYPENDMAGLLTAASLSKENQEYFTSERFAEIAKEIKDDPSMIDSLGKLLQGKDMGESEYYALVDNLVAIEHRIHPDNTESEILERIRNLG